MGKKSKSNAEKVEDVGEAAITSSQEHIEIVNAEGEETEDQQVKEHKEESVPLEVKPSKNIGFEQIIEEKKDKKGGKEKKGKKKEVKEGKDASNLEVNEKPAKKSKKQKNEEAPKLTEKPSVAKKPSTIGEEPPEITEETSKVTEKASKTRRNEGKSVSVLQVIETDSQLMRKKKTAGKKKAAEKAEKTEKAEKAAEKETASPKEKGSKKKGKPEKVASLVRNKSQVLGGGGSAEKGLKLSKSKTNQSRSSVSKMSTARLSFIQQFLASREEEDSDDSGDSEILLKTFDTKKKKGKKEKGKESKEAKEAKIKEEVVVPKETEEAATATSATEMEAAPAEPKPKKSPKKKGKKGKKEDEVTSEDLCPLLKEIRTMKPFIEAEEFKGIRLKAKSEEFDVDKAKEVKTKKKKAKKKEKKAKAGKLTAKQLAEQQLEAEAKAAREAAEEQLRIAAERKAALEKEKREEAEYNIRLEQLIASCNFIENILLKRYRHTVFLEKEKEEWEFYLMCSKLPDAAKCPDMSTYIHLWNHDMEFSTIEDLASRTTDVLKLLEDLEYLIDTATPEEKKYLENWKWIRALFRRNQAENMDVMTYKLLRYIDRNLNRLDIETADFHYEDANFKTSIWLRMQLPVPLHNPRKPAKPRINLNFSNLNMEFVLPASIDGNKTAVNGRYFVYDHLSDTCESNQVPEIPEAYRKNLVQTAIYERRFIKRYKWDRRLKYVPADETGENANAEPAPPDELFEPGVDDDVPLVPYQKLVPSASEYFLHVDGSTFLNVRQGLKKTFPDGVINLRKYTILGGIYELSLLQQPPQPQDFVTMETHLTCLFLPKVLERVDFYVPYTPPAPREEGARREPEEIEEELKKQEEDMDKLIFITIKWPDHVIFLELPMVCQWDETDKCWSQKDIHDVKHNEEKCIVSFRTGRFGTFGLGTFRYANLPYQTWEMKPETNGSVTFQITAAVLLIEFNVKDGMVALTQLQNSPNKTMQNIIGKYMKLASLVKIMKVSGVDIFPSFDTFCYVDGCCEKHWPTEEHLYYNMASVSQCYNFCWSRWNQTAGRRNIVMQMREYDHNKTKQSNYSMLLVTPLQAKIINSTEVSQLFCTDGLEDQKFQANLFNLVRVMSNISTRNKMSTTAPELVYVLAQLLIATRVFCFS